MVYTGFILYPHVLELMNGTGMYVTKAQMEKLGHITDQQKVLWHDKAGKVVPPDLQVTKIGKHLMMFLLNLFCDEDTLLEPAHADKWETTHGGKCQIGHTHLIKTFISRYFYT